jgi:4-diphosphocytidyl-2-C-methyl-D-erythritol kinase
VTDVVTVQAHAKINLLLRVLAREEEGFHSIETLFALIDLHDVLRVERTAGGIDLDVAGPDTGPTERNLAYRAADMVLEATGRTFGVRVRLEKRIPILAGLGGGSSDGAAALHAVNALADNAVPRPELLQFAARLGSDVPFLFSGAPLALGWGHGERLFRLPAPAAAPALLAIPRVRVATPHAYALIDAARVHGQRRGPVVLDATAFAGWGDIGRLGGNDFESVVFREHPVVRESFERMAATRPLLVRLCGSGSAVAAVYKDERDRDEAARELGERDWDLVSTMTRAAPAPGIAMVDTP